MTDRLEHESALHARGFLRVAGIDEAGRGPIAGPVVAAAVVIPAGFDANGVGDSKKLTPRQREAAFARIIAECHWALGIAEADEIDRINILRATHEAMRRALAGLTPPVDAVLVDGLPVKNLHPNCQALVGGDGLSVSIGAASILAKVTRDRLMVNYDARWPEYAAQARVNEDWRRQIERNLRLTLPRR